MKFFMNHTLTDKTIYMSQKYRKYERLLWTFPYSNLQEFSINIPQENN